MWKRCLEGEGRFGTQIGKLHAEILRRARCDELPDPGYGGDIIKIAMIRVDQRLRKEKLRSRLVLQVHDELLIETWTDELEKVQKVLEEEMKNAAHLKVELEIDMKTGHSWFETK